MSLWLGPSSIQRRMHDLCLPATPAARAASTSSQPERDTTDAPAAVKRRRVTPADARALGEPCHRIISRDRSLPRQGRTLRTLQEVGSLEDRPVIEHCCCDVGL